jgi:hypothetical protein
LIGKLSHFVGYESRSVIQCCNVRVNVQFFIILI